MIDTIKIGALLVFGFVLNSCGGNSGSHIEKGITVHFEIQHRQSQQADGSILQSQEGAKRFTNSEGVIITLNTAYLTLWSVTLETGCQDPAFVKRSPVDWLISPAEAHADESPTRLSIPNVVNLLAADGTALSLGTIAPPPGDYCGIIAELLPADDDAQYLPQDIDMVGRSLYIEGTYQLPTENATVTSFMIDTGRRLQEAKRRFPSLMTLSSHQRQGAVQLSLIYDRWFDAVNFAQLEDLSQQDLVLNQVSQFVQVVP